VDKSVSPDPLAVPPELVAEIRAAEDRGPMTEEYRRSFHDKIAQGLQALREGKGTDGEAFMAEMLAELTELEQQEHL
jgi:hypothetical protein